MEDNTLLRKTEAAQKTMRIVMPDDHHQAYIIRNLATREEIRSELEMLAITEQDEIDQQQEGCLIGELEGTLEDLWVRKQKYSKRYTMTLELKGEAESGKVWLFGNLITPEKSLKYRNHSPTGFQWSYGGSGPAQLALALCIEIMGVDKALSVYQDFKWKYIATLPKGDFEQDIFIDVE